MSLQGRFVFTAKKAFSALFSTLCYKANPKVRYSREGWSTTGWYHLKPRWYSPLWMLVFLWKLFLASLVGGLPGVKDLLRDEFSPWDILEVQFKLDSCSRDNLRGRMRTWLAIWVLVYTNQE